MRLTPKQMAAVSVWWAESRRQICPKLCDVQEILELQSGVLARDDYDLDGHFAFPFHRAKFDPDDIAEELGRSRYEEICHGQTPTDQEIQMWADKKSALVFEEDGCWYHFYIWRIELPDVCLYFRSLHGDGGLLDYFDGPFGGVEDALADAGNLKINRRA